MPIELLYAPKIACRLKFYTRLGGIFPTEPRVVCGFRKKDDSRPDSAECLREGLSLPADAEPRGRSL